MRDQCVELGSTIRCRCNFEIPVQPEDRGFAVYCPSCGQACTVAGEAAQPELHAEPAPRTSIFSRQSLDRFNATTVGQIACLCGARVDVTAGDYGTTLYCPSCGAELFPGEQWKTPAAAQTRVATPALDGQTPGNVSAPTPRRRKRWASLAAFAVLAAAAIAGWQALPSASLSGGRSGWSRILRWAPQEMAASLSTDASSNRAAKLGNSSDEAIPPKEPEDPTLAITLEKIERLLTVEDRETALVDAQVWQQLLIDRGISESDPRRQRLPQVIDALIEALAPKPSPPDPAIETFRALLGRLREALAGEQLELARQLHQEAAGLFQTRAAALAPYSRAFLLLQARLKQLEGRIEGVRLMEELFQRAIEKANAGEALEAMEARAKALHMTQEAYAISDAEEERLKSLAEKLRDPLRLARGKRAVEEAQKCHELRDREARDGRLHLARSLLPGLPESQIKPLMASVEKLASQPIAQPKASDLGLAMTARGVYENALEQFGRGQLSELVASAAELAQLKASPEADAYRERTIAIVFATLDSRLTDVASRTINSEDLASSLEELQQAVDKLDAWQNDPRLIAIQAAVGAQGSEIAASSLANAQRLAAQDRLAEAVAAVQIATQVGKAEDRKRAERLRADWQAELDLRASLPAQNDHWQRIARLAAAGKTIEAMQEMLVFEQRYPRTPHRDDLQTLKLKLEPDINRTVDEIVARASGFQKAKQWPSFASEVKQLDALPIPGDREQDCSRLREELDRLMALAEGRMEEARRAARLVKDDEIIAVLEAAGEVAAIFPDYPGAAELLARARSAGKARAERILKKAEAFRRNRRTSATYEKLLETATRLDPTGAQGAKARQTLKALKGT